MTTYSVGQAMVACLRADPILDALCRTIAYHGGEYTEKEIQRYGNSAPALLLTWLGSEEESAFPAEVIVEGKWSMYIITNRRDRHEAGQLIHDRILSLFRSIDPFAPATYASPEKVSSMNAYSSKLDAMGIELIVIGWTQTYRLDDLLDVDALPPFLELDVCWWPDGTRPGVPVPIGAAGCLAEDILVLEQ